MPASLEGQLVVAISSRALFDFEEENLFFEQSDDAAYMKLQFERLDQPAPQGPAAPLVKKLLAFNQGKPAATEAKIGGAVSSNSAPTLTPEHRVEVVILSRNDPVSGMRVFRSAKHAGLSIERGVFTRGREPWRYLHSLNANLFLSVNESDVRAALNAGYPAARVYPTSKRAAESHPDEIRIAFDGDAVLFSDEAETVFKQQGLPSFVDHEVKHLARPLPAGPFAPLLKALHTLQQVAGKEAPMKIRTALVTARSAPAHERAIRTLIDWNVAVDEAMFLGGLDKGSFLREFEPDFFFDDQTHHCEGAALVAPTGHVISGIANS